MTTVYVATFSSHHALEYGPKRAFNEYLRYGTTEFDADLSDGGSSFVLSVAEYQYASKDDADTAIRMAQGVAADSSDHDRQKHTRCHFFTDADVDVPTSA
jgi:hypothetical protein